MSDLGHIIDTRSNRIAELEAENKRLREALEAVALPPYQDSDLKSLLETLQAIAKAALESK